MTKNVVVVDKLWWTFQNIGYFFREVKKIQEFMFHVCMHVCTYVCMYVCIMYECGEEKNAIKYFSV